MTDILQSLKKAFSLLTLDQRDKALKVILLLAAMALLETAGVLSVMPFLAVLGNPDIVNTNPILSSMYSWAASFGVQNTIQFLIILALGSFIFVIFTAAFRSYTQYTVNVFIEMGRHSIGARLLEGYLRQPYAFFLNRHSGEMSKMILSEVDQINLDVLRPIYNMIAYSLTVFAIATILIVINPWLMLLVVGIFGGLYALIFLLLKDKLALLGEELVNSNRSRFIAASEAFGGIKDIKLLGCERSYLIRFQNASRRFAVTLAIQQTLTQLPNYLIEAIVFGGVLLLSIAMLVNAGGLESGALGQVLPILGLYTFAAYRIKPAVQYIYQGIAGLRYGKLALDNLCTDINLGSKSMAPSVAGTRSLKVNQSIGIKNLSFTYPKVANPTLVNLNFDIPAGSSIGLVGGSGAGKTTLIDVILGLLLPTSGIMTIDGEPITTENLSAWQKNLGYVPQVIFLADSSVAENIALGIPKGEIDHEQVIRSARMAQVHDFIMGELPNQYLTHVGERGIRLSGGQRQRIGIARALYHNPDVLIFDEATSALDNLTEKAVMDSIDTLAHQKTIIIIAHRLSTVKNCDQIVLLDKGRVVAKGSLEKVSGESQKFKAMLSQNR